jgi:hypothetical protein
MDNLNISALEYQFRMPYTYFLNRFFILLFKRSKIQISKISVFYEHLSKNEILGISPDNKQVKRGKY